MLKQKHTTEEIADKVLRGYLLRCFSDASRQYPEVLNMSPKDGVDELLRLKKQNMIEIKLYSINGYSIGLSMNRKN